MNECTLKADSIAQIIQIHYIKTIDYKSDGIDI